MDAVGDCLPYKMKFGKYLEEKQRPEWAGKYVDYGSLKDLIKEAFKEHQESVSCMLLVNVSFDWCLWSGNGYATRVVLIVVHSFYAGDNFIFSKDNVADGAAS